jgi:hypothetical protein
VLCMGTGDYLRGFLDGHMYKSHAYEEIRGTLVCRKCGMVYAQPMQPCAENIFKVKTRKGERDA